MSSKYVDITAITQVIGCVFNNPLLLSYTDKYTITDADFPNDFHRIIFGAIYKLYEQNVTHISLENIYDFLSTRPKSLAVFETQKGEEWLLQASQIATGQGFDYYYHRLKKFTLLRAYDDLGLNLEDIYDINNIFDSKKKQLQEEWLDNTSIENIADAIDSKILSIRLEYVDNDFGEAVQAGEGMLELIDKFKKAPEVGVPMYGPFINTITRGARLKKFYLRSGATGTGKAIPNYTMIPTPNGYRKVGDIRPGDYLFGQDGKPTKVIAIHPQPNQKEIWKVTFADGRVAECCGEHLWGYRYETHKGYEYRVEDIQTIYERSLKLKNSEGGDYEFYIPMNQPAEYPKKKHYLPPYAMGALLGDSGFRCNNQNKTLEFSSANAELPTLVAKSLGNKYQARKSLEKDCSWTFRHKDNPSHSLQIEELLKNYPDLWNAKSEDKYIPEEYLLDSINQRMCLLQGLMDTDGSIDEKGQTFFTTISLKLRDDFIELCHSLGFCATYSVDARNQYTTGECYNIHIQAPKSMKTQFFRTKRKYLVAERYNQSDKQEDYLAIVNIEKTTQLADMTCFTVDNDDHLFLMNDYIVTHNTRTMIADACYIGCNQIYDENFGWIRNGTAEPSLYITTEQETEEIQTMMMAFLSNVEEEHILNGKYEGDEEERVRKAAQVVLESPLYIEELPDFSLQDIENKIKKNLRDHDVKYVFFDYIHSSLKILEEITHKSGGVKLREDNILFMLSIRLKDLCNQYGIFILSSTQLNGDWKNAEVPDQNLLRGAKSIADKIDWGAILLPVNTEDLDALEGVLSSNGFETPIVKISVYKNRRGRYKGIYLWCKGSLGTCRLQPMFCTTYDYEILSVEDIKIIVEEESAF